MTFEKAGTATLAAVVVLLFLCASPAAAARIRGTVFEDVNYGGGAGRSLAASLGVARDGARVELYDSTGAFVTFTLTAAAGGFNYQFGPVGIPNGTYTVRVVNSTVTSSRTGYVAGLLPVQTYRTNASSGAALAVTDHVGGEVPSLVDAGNGTTTLAALTTATTTAQSITNVSVVGNINGVDFGFNFDTIVNVNDSGQGSLRQFLLNSNALGNATLAIVGQTAGKDVSVFMISDGLVHAGLRAGIANLLSGAGVAVITPVTALPAITAADTSVDGTTQTANVGNTNAVVLGTGGTVGVDGLALSTVAGPEVEIRGSGTLANGLLIQAANAVVRGLAIHGFGTVSGEGGVRVDAFPNTNALIENNVLGSRATSFTDPGSAQRNEAGVASVGGSSSTVRNNLIGFSRVVGVDLTAGTTGWTITGNELRDNGMDTADGDGITINAGSTNTSIGNLITGTSSQAFVVTVAPANANVFTNNTVTGNGVGIPSGLAQSAAITVRSGATSTVLDRNVIRANYGAGVQANDGSTGTRMTRNSVALNGTIVARNLSAATGQIGIDLNSPTDDINYGTAPFYTLNDAGDADTGGNGLLNFPVLVWATLFGGNLSLRGYARPGSVIEVFIASPDPTGFGEGTTYGITLTEGGTGAGGNDPYADADPGTGTYGPGSVNGIAQGTDTTNRFTFFFPAPGGVGVGTRLTATATLGGETSEFSGNVTVTAATAVKLMSFEAAPSDGAVDLSWRTGSELDNLGFHLLPLLVGLRALDAADVVSHPRARLLASGAELLLARLGSGERAALLLPAGGRGHVVGVDVPRAGVGGASGAGAASPGWRRRRWRGRAGRRVRAGRLDEHVVPGVGPGGVRVGCFRRRGRCGALAHVHEARGSRVGVARRRVSRRVVGDAGAADGGLLGVARSERWPVGRGGAVGCGACVRSGVRLPDGAEGSGVAVASRSRGRGGREEGEPRLGGGLGPAGLPGASSLGGGSGGDERVGGTGRYGRRDGLCRLPSSRAGICRRSLARLAGTAFQGEKKSAVVEITPVRFDGSRQELVLAGRVRVKLAFTGREDGEIGTGSRGRVLPRRGSVLREVLAHVHTSGRGLYAVSLRVALPGAPRGVSRRRSCGCSGRERRCRSTWSRRGRCSVRGSVLYFYADRTASSTDYSGEVAYELVRSSGAQMGVALGRPVGAPVRFVLDGVCVLRDEPDLPGGASGGPGHLAVGRDGVGGASEGRRPSRSRGWTRRLRTSGGWCFDLQGGSESGLTVDHHVRVSVNGVDVGEATFAGKQPYRLDALVPAGLLREGSNDLAITNVGDTGVYSLVFLDRFEVSYPQAPTVRRWSVRGGVERGRDGGGAAGSPAPRSWWT